MTEFSPEQRAARSLIEWWASAGVAIDIPAMDAGVSGRASPSFSPPPPRPAPAEGVRAPAVDIGKGSAAAAQSLRELRAAVEAFEGCGLKATARTTVFGDGAED